MSVATGPALCLIEHLYLLNLPLLMSCYDHLCDALAIIDDEWFVGEVDKQHHDLSTVIGIDGARGVEHGESVFESQTAAWTYLSFKARRKCDIKSCAYELSLHGLQCDG